MRAPLTPIEQQVYHFLLDFLAEHTFQPSVRDIAKRLRIPSTRSVTDLLASLERKGYVEREPGRSRGVRLVGYATSGGSQRVPVRDPLSRGIGTEGEYMTLDRRLIGDADAFLMWMGPDAPVSRAVMPGDLLVVQPSARANDGDLVALRLGATVLVRAVLHRGGAIVLEGGSTGEQHTLTVIDDYEVLGVVGAIVRSLRPPSSQAPQKPGLDERSS